MRHGDIDVLLDDLFWVRDRILTATEPWTADEFRSRDTLVTRDLRATLVHQLENEWAWRVSSPAAPLPTAAWIRPTSRPLPGDIDDLPLWRYVAYVVTHGVQLYSEAAVLLTRLGHSPGEVGFLEFSSRRRAPS